MPLRIKAYILSCAVGAGAFAFLAVRGDHTAFHWDAAIAFGALSFLAEQFPVRLPNGTTYSVSFVLTIATIVAVGPAEAIVATLLGTVHVRDMRHRPPLRHLFNASQLALSASAGALVFVQVGGHPGQISHLARHVVLPLLACTAANFPVNTLLVSGAVALSEHRRVFEVWRAQYATLWRTYVAFALLGLLVGVLYLQSRAGAVIFLLMPLLVARHAFHAAVTMQGAHDATVSSLIKAIETKDPYTRGHAERVAQLTEMTARAYGLPEERCRLIRFAALMHDVGKLGVSSKVLQKPGKLTPEEYEHMKEHPVRGVEIVGEINLLRDAGAIEGVRHHHERMDGAGYPDGRSGVDIPLIARLIMVCDAFDSMTSTRVYRKAKDIEAAFVELRRCSGTQFDPDALTALEQAVERNGWTPLPEGTDDEEVRKSHGPIHQATP